MEKIIENLIKELTTQRGQLIEQVAMLDELSMNVHVKQTSLESSILTIDMKITDHLKLLINK